MPPPSSPARVRTGLRVGVALAACLVVTACSGGSGELRVGGVETPAEEPSASEPTEPSEDAETVEPTQEPTEEPTELPTPAPTEGATGLTEPLTPGGTELQVGQNAVVAAEGDGGGLGAVSFTITDVARPGAGDLDAASRRSAVVVRYDVLALEGADLLAGWSPGVELAGVTSEGSYLGAIAVVGGLEGCEGVEVPQGWTEGESLQGCTLLQSPPRTPMVAIGYLGGGEAAPGPEPVTWAVEVP